MKWATLRYERFLWRSGKRYIAGIDEVGRGSWAGPVVAAAVVLPPGWRKPKNLADSKLLRPIDREKLARVIKREAVSYAIAETSVAVINREGVGRATQRAFRRAIKDLNVRPDFHLIDAFYIKYLPKKSQLPIVKGDEKCASIAAASIIAKVYRDRQMKNLSRQYPDYGFAKHKGYGTKEHQSAIKERGFSPVHRLSFDLSFLDVSMVSY